MLSPWSNSPFAEQEPLLDSINMTPFIDVMLVLLIVFMVTLPTIHRAIKVDLPKANASVAQPAPHSIDISIDAAGQIYWNKQPVDDNTLKFRLNALGAGQPEIMLYADQAARYGRIALVMSSARQAGQNKLDFVMSPTLTKK